MKYFTLIITLFAFSLLGKSQELIDLKCRKKSKGECLIPKKEIYKYENGRYLIKEYNKEGTQKFTMDSAISIDVLDGHVQYFNNDGSISMSGYYDNNLISGTWRIYGFNGEFEREISYDFKENPVDTSLLQKPENVDGFDEILPSFRGGGLNDFRMFVQENLFYPPICAENGIQGQVFVAFSVDKYGNVGDVEITRGVEENLDKETMRAILTSPKWIPGYQKGKAVKVHFTFPVVFILQ